MSPYSKGHLSHSVGRYISENDYYGEGEWFFKYVLDIFWIHQNMPICIIIYDGIFNFKNII